MISLAWNALAVGTPKEAPQPAYNAITRRTLNQGWICLNEATMSIQYRTVQNARARCVGLGRKPLLLPFRGAASYPMRSQRAYL